MTTTDFADLTPPDELIEQWIDAAWGDPDVSSRQYITAQAARWGAQQGYQRGADDELEAVCGWERIHAGVVFRSGTSRVEALRAARRPAPPSLKQQALEDFDLLMSELDGAGNYSNCADRLRRALALIPEDAQCQ